MVLVTVIQSRYTVLSFHKDSFDPSPLAVSPNLSPLRSRESGVETGLTVGMREAKVGQVGSLWTVFLFCVVGVANHAQPQPGIIKKSLSRRAAFFEKEINAKTKPPKSDEGWDGACQAGESVSMAPLPGPGLEAWTVKTNPGRHRSDGERRMATATRNSGRSNGNSRHFLNINADVRAEAQLLPCDQEQEPR